MDQPTPDLDRYPTVVVEFAERPGLRQVSLNPVDAIRHSNEALHKAMGIIHSVAERVTDAVTAVARPPTELQVEFGIKFDLESHAVLAKATAGASITVTMTWRAKPPADPVKPAPDDEC